MTKKTFEFSEFVRQAKTQWASKYEYPEGKNFHMSKMITIVCPEHGPFQQRPVSHLQRIGCKQCGSRARTAPDNVWVFGKIGIISHSNSGHVGFDLDGEMNGVDCVMFYHHAKSIKADFEEGDHVLVQGTPQLYKGQSNVQFVVQDLEQIGKDKTPVKDDYLTVDQLVDQIERYKKWGKWISISELEREEYTGDAHIETIVNDALKRDFSRDRIRSTIVVPWIALQYLNYFSRRADAEELLVTDAVAATSKSNFYAELLPKDYRFSSLYKLRGGALRRFFNHDMGHLISEHSELNPQLKLVLKALTYIHPPFRDSLFESVASESYDPGKMSLSSAVSRLDRWSTDESLTGAEDSKLYSFLAQLAEPRLSERLLVGGFSSRHLFLYSALRSRENAINHPGEISWELRQADTPANNKWFVADNDREDRHVVLATQLLLNGITIVADFRTNELNRGADISSEHLSEHKLYDCILAICPVGQWSEDRRHREDIYLERIMDSLAEGGRAIVVVPNSLLSRERNTSKLRQRLVQSFHLDGVISLPRGVFQPYSSIKASALVFRREDANDNILFRSIQDFDSPDKEVEKFRQVDVSANGWTLTNEELAEQDWDLLVKPNRDDEHKELLEEIVAADQSTSIKRLDELAEIFPGVAKVRKDSSKPTQPRPTVRIVDIQLHNILDSSIRSEPLPTDYPEKRLLREGDILLSTVGTIGKVGYVHQSSRCIGGVARQNLTVIRPKETVLAEYLAELLKSESVQNWLKDHARGEVQKLKLKEVGKLPLPQLEEISHQGSIVDLVESTHHDMLKGILANVTRSGDPFVNWLLTDRDLQHLTRQHGQNDSEDATDIRGYRASIEAFTRSFKFNKLNEFDDWSSSIGWMLSDESAQQKSIDPIEFFSYSLCNNLADVIDHMSPVLEFPEGPERYAVLELVKAKVGAIPSRFSSNTVLFKQISLLKQALSTYLDKEVEVLFSDTQITVDKKASLVEPDNDKSTEIPLVLHNHSKMPMRNVKLEFTGPFTEDAVHVFSGNVRDKQLLSSKDSWRFSFSYFAAGTSHKVTLRLPKPLAEVPAASRQGLVAIVCKWTAVRLDGTRIEGIGSTPLSVTFGSDLRSEYQDRFENWPGWDEDVETDQMREEFEEYFLEQLEYYGEGSIEADEALIPSEEEEEAQFLADEAMVFDEAEEAAYIAEAAAEEEFLEDAILERAEAAAESEFRHSSSFGEDGPFDLGQSPFNAGAHPEDRPNMFIGRDRIIRQIDQSLGGGNVVILQGNRRTGKSSILKNIQKRKSAEGWVVPYVDFQEGDSVQLDNGRPAIKLSEVFRLVALELGVSVYEICDEEVPLPDQERTARKKPFREEFTTKSRQSFSQERSGAEPPYDIFKAYLERVLAVTGDTTILLVLDEFDMLQEGIDAGVTNAQVPSNLRALIQHNNSLSAIIAKYPDLQSKRKQYFQPFFALGQSLNVGPLERDDAVKLVTRPVADKLIYQRGTADLIVDACGCRPFLIQCFCQQLFGMALFEKTQIINESMVNEVIDDQQFMHVYFEELFNRDSESARRRLILSIMARHRRSSTAIDSSNGREASDPITYAELWNKLRDEDVYYLEKSGALDEDLKILDRLEFLTTSLGSSVSYQLTPPLWDYWIRRSNHEALARAAVNESEIIQSDLESESLDD